MDQILRHAVPALAVCVGLVALIGIGFILPPHQDGAAVFYAGPQTPIGATWSEPAR